MGVVSLAMLRWEDSEKSVSLHPHASLAEPSEPGGCLETRTAVAWPRVPWLQRSGDLATNRAHLGSHFAALQGTQLLCALHRPAQRALPPLLALVSLSAPSESPSVALKASGILASTL
jgi:hypothetical protein